MSTGAPPLSGTPKPQAKALNCPKCGAAITLRSFGQAETVVCGSCHAILDAKDPNLAILQQFEAATGEVKPLIPLGTRGKLRDRKSTRLNSSHVAISYAVFCLKKKK